MRAIPIEDYNLQPLEKAYYKVASTEGLLNALIANDNYKNDFFQQLTETYAKDYVDYINLRNQFNREYASTKQCDTDKRWSIDFTTNTLYFYD